MLALRGGSPEGLADEAAPKRGIRMFFRAMAGATSVAALTAAVLLVPQAQAATPVQLTGTQLRSALLPTSYFPSGYKVEKFGDYNSGRRLEHSPAKYHLATFSCQKYILNGFPETGFGETATAQDVITNSRLGAYQQTVWQFATSSQAATFYQQMYAFTFRCRTVTVTAPTYTARLTTQSLKKTRLGGRQAFQAVQTETATGFAATINDTLVTVAGTDVFLLDALGHKVPAKPAATTALLHLVTRVQAWR
jgi:hypothetical protein